MKRFFLYFFILILFSYQAFAQDSESELSPNEVFIEELGRVMNYLNPDDYNEETFPYWNYSHDFFNYDYISKEFYPSLPYDSDDFDFRKYYFPDLNSLNSLTFETSLLNYFYAIPLAWQHLNRNIHKVHILDLFKNFDCKRCYFTALYSYNSPVLNYESAIEVNNLYFNENIKFSDEDPYLLDYYGVPSIHLKDLNDSNFPVRNYNPFDDDQYTIWFYNLKFGNSNYLLIESPLETNPFNYSKNYVLSFRDVYFSNVTSTSFYDKIKFSGLIFYESSDSSHNEYLVIGDNKTDRFANSLIIKLSDFAFGFNILCGSPDCILFEISEDSFVLDKDSFTFKSPENINLSWFNSYDLKQRYFLDFELKENDELTISGDSDVFFFNISSLDGSISFSNSYNEISTFDFAKKSIIFRNSPEPKEQMKPFILLLNNQFLLSYKYGITIFLPYEKVKHLFSDNLNYSYIQENIHEDFKDFIISDKSYLLLLEEFPFDFINFEKLEYLEVLAVRNSLRQVPSHFYDLISFIEYHPAVFDEKNKRYIYSEDSADADPHSFSINIYGRPFSKLHERHIFSTLPHEIAHLYEFFLDAISIHEDFYNNPFLIFPKFKLMNEQFKDYYSKLLIYGTPVKVITSIHKSGDKEIVINGGLSKKVFYTLDDSYKKISQPKACVRRYGCKNSMEDVATIVEVGYVYMDENRESSSDEYLSSVYPKLIERLDSGSELYEPRIEQKIDYLWRMGFAPKHVFDNIFPVERPWKIFNQDIPDLSDIDILSESDDVNYDLDFLFTSLNKKSLDLIREKFLSFVSLDNNFKNIILSQENLDPNLLLAIMLSDIQNEIGSELRGLSTSDSQTSELANFEISSDLIYDYYYNDLSFFGLFYFWNINCAGEFSSYCSDSDNTFSSKDQTVSFLDSIYITPPDINMENADYYFSSIDAFISSFNNRFDIQIYDLKYEGSDISSLSNSYAIVSELNHKDLIRAINHFEGSTDIALRKVEISKSACKMDVYAELFPRLFLDIEGKKRSELIYFEYSDLPISSLIRGDNNYEFKLHYNNPLCISIDQLDFLLSLLEKYSEDNFGKVDLEKIGNLYRNGFPAAAEYYTIKESDYLDSHSWIEETSFGELVKDNYKYLKKQKLFD